MKIKNLLAIGLATMIVVFTSCREIDVVLPPKINLDVVGDSAYVYAVEWSHNTQKNTITYGIFNIRTKEVVSRNFITDGTDKDIVIPYGVKVNPVTKDIYVTDAIDYVTPGTPICYNKFGKLKWKVDTGDIPGHIAFLYE